MAEKLGRPNYRNCDGMKIPGAFSVEACRSAIKYKPKAGEIYVVTFPKCGTTWMQYICMLIMRRGKPIEDGKDYLKNTPFLELTGADGIDFMSGPGPIKLHLPFNLTPFSPDAKYIYVARNPRDCCVSFYHHTKGIPFYNFQDGTFDEFFELFIKGETDFGDYFDHHLSWYEHKDDPNVHFLTYEDLKRDTKGEILKIAKFMSEDYYECLKNDSKLVEDILKHSSLAYMKKNLNADFDKIFRGTDTSTHQEIEVPSGVKAFFEFIEKHPIKAIGKCEFVRKGIVGDWKNHFSPEQERRMEERIREKTTGSGLMNLWKEP